MPAHICHSVFAEEALLVALGDDGRSLIERAGPWLRLAAQGPDLFYHNRISKPSGLMAGSLLHQAGYGSFIRRWIESRAWSSENNPSIPYAIILGFVSHAFLDRRTHPYIDFHSGWVNPRNPSSVRYYRCHAFFERIIDVLILRERRAVDIADYDFYALLPDSLDWPQAVVESMSGALYDSYPRLTRIEHLETRIRNAYQDARRFYRHTNFQNWQDRMAAAKLDFEGTFKRRLALYHPDRIPVDIDFLNKSGKSWAHPCRDESSTTLSFVHLYEEALARCVEAFRLTWGALQGRDDVGRLEEYIGNISLNTTCEPPGPLRATSPLPLAEILDAAYERMRKAPAH